MKKLSNLLFYLLAFFLFVYSIWPREQKTYILFMIVFAILDLIIIFKGNKKNFRVDILDILIGLLPILYFIPYLLQKNVYSFKEGVFSILLELIVTFTILILRRFLTKDKTSNLLTILVTISTIYFFVSFVCQTWPKKMVFLDIFSYFGDTYLNSIDRFYGTFDYCNASALLFIISIFISFFQLEDDKENIYIFKFILFINVLGFLFTFSKMLLLDFIFVLILLLIHLHIRKKKELLKIIKLNLFALIIPSLVMISFYRDFLINLNLFLFLLRICLCYGCYLGLSYILSLIYDKNRIIFYVINSCLFGLIFYLTYNPVSTALNISNVYSKNDFILTDFILDDNKDYEIIIDTSSKKTSGVTFSLCRLYLASLYPQEEVIETFDESSKIKFSFKVKKNSEYYYIKVNNLNSLTNIRINYLKINGKFWLINSLLVPYDYIHQFNLVSYDRDSAFHRFWYYEDAMNILNDHGYILGQGKDTFRYYASSYQHDYLETDPHSYFFQLWLDIGIYGCIYVLLLIILGIYFIWKNRKENSIIVWFCIFSLCIIVLPFDCIYTLLYFKALLIISFILIHDITREEILKKGN